jgi:hypothetical protein
MASEREEECDDVPQIESSMKLTVDENDSFHQSDRGWNGAREEEKKIV